MRRWPDWAVPGWESAIAFAGFGAIDLVVRAVLEPLTRGLGPPALSRLWLSPGWWLAALCMFAVIDTTSAAYAIARNRIGVQGVAVANAHETLRRMPSWIWPGVAAIAAAYAVQMVGHLRL